VLSKIREQVTLAITLAFARSPSAKPQGGASRGRKLIGREPIHLIVGWCGRFLFFVVPCQFSQDIGEEGGARTMEIGSIRNQREKIDWQEPRKFDYLLVRMIFIF